MCLRYPLVPLLLHREEYLEAFERKWREEQGYTSGTEEESEEEEGDEGEEGGQEPSPQQQEQQPGSESEWLGGGTAEERNWWDGSGSSKDGEGSSEQQQQLPAPLVVALPSTPAAAPRVPAADAGRTSSGSGGWRERFFGSALGFFSRRRWRPGTEAAPALEPPITARQLRQREEEDEALAAVAAAEQEMMQDVLVEAAGGGVDDGMQDGVTTPRSEASAVHSERMREERDVTEEVFAALRLANGSAAPDAASEGNGDTDAEPPPVPLRPVQEQRQRQCERLQLQPLLQPPPPQPSLAPAAAQAPPPVSPPRLQRRLCYHAGGPRHRSKRAFPSSYEWGWWKKPLTHTDPDRIRRGHRRRHSGCT